QLVSVDDHVLEHPRVWSDRLPAKHREAGPRMVDEDGHYYWLYEDTREAAFKYMSTMAGENKEDFTTAPRRIEDFRPGCLDPVERAKDMDIDGVAVQTPFPSYARFSGTRFLFGKDKELALLC